MLCRISRVSLWRWKCEKALSRFPYSFDTVICNCSECHCKSLFAQKFFLSIKLCLYNSLILVVSLWILNINVVLPLKFAVRHGYQSMVCKNFWTKQRSLLFKQYFAICEERWKLEPLNKIIVRLCDFKVGKLTPSLIVKLDAKHCIFGISH